MSRRLVLLALAALALILPSAAWAKPVPAGYTYSHHFYEDYEGTQQHAGVFLPEDRKPGERHPVILTITPYAAPNADATVPGTTSGPANRFPELFSGEVDILNNGRYAYVQVDARSFGGSGGCWEYYGVKEAINAGEAVEWAASQDWSTGKVGLYGKSYDAATQILAMGQRPEGLATAIIQAPGLSGYTGLWYDGVHYATGRYATSASYTADDLSPGHSADTLTVPEYTFAFADGLTQSPKCRVEQLALANVIGNREDPFWNGREPYLLAKGDDTPVFWSHGFFDANTKPVHLDVWESLTGPKKAWFGQYTHLRGQESGVGRHEAFLGEMKRWLDFYVRGVGSVSKDPVMTIQEGSRDGAWRSEAAWPPADAAPWTMPLKAGSYTDTTGNQARRPGQGLWSATPPLEHPAHLAGEAVMQLEVTTQVPETVAVAHLYDYDPKTGQATFVQRGATKIFASGAQDKTLRLYPTDYRFERGHQILVRLSASDDAWWTGGVTQTKVEVADGSLTLPLLGRERTPNLDGGPSDGMTAPFDVPAATVAGAVVGSAQPPRPARPKRSRAVVRRAAAKRRLALRATARR